MRFGFPRWNNLSRFRNLNVACKREREKEREEKKRKKKKKRGKKNLLRRIAGTRI